MSSQRLSHSQAVRPLCMKPEDSPRAAALGVEQKVNGTPWTLHRSLQTRRCKAWVSNELKSFPPTQLFYTNDSWHSKITNSGRTVINFIVHGGQNYCSSVVGLHGLVLSTRISMSYCRVVQKSSLSSSFILPRSFSLSQTLRSSDVRQKGGIQSSHKCMHNL